MLANAEGIDDTFDEVFKLIYAKLYDEWAAANDPSRKRRIHFRIYGESPAELYQKIDDLFQRAKNKWRGIFMPTEHIRLRPEHLMTCVSFLQDVKLFNSNLQVIDDAFEYLMTDVAKGKKGQYFTPRWVIDMAIKMLNPKIYERVIDTACGSSGFTVHTIFWVAGDEFTTNGLPRHISEYAGEMVYAIDSSPKAVKIAKALNLIAGDGRSNVYELNSLNPPKWSEEGKAAFRPLLTRFPDDPQRDQENQEKFQYFDFDVLLTNPPFAGNINEREILRQYRLAERNGRTVSKIGRDILFIERNLNFLCPGGRMAIVLPQGRLNNTNDLYIRKFLFDKARILAVVGLHGNTFKPHTGTKTSIVFLQKYTEEELAEIRKVRNRHAAAWESHLAELQTWAEQGIEEDDAPPLLVAFLESEFESTVAEDENFDGKEPESDEELVDRMEDLQQRLDELYAIPERRRALKNEIKALTSLKKQRGRLEQRLQKKKEKLSSLSGRQVRTKEKLSAEIEKIFQELGEIDHSEDLDAQIKELSEVLASLPARPSGIKALERALDDTKYRLASRTFEGRLNYLLQNDRMLERYRDLWLEDQAAKDLDYPIFFAVSERGGKDNSGEPIYKKDENGQPLLDEHGHLIVDHDLDEIAEAFIQFAKEQGFDFWMEG